MTSAGPLEIGLTRPLHVREERLTPRHDACRLLYASDIHLRAGRSDTLCRQIMDAATACQPDVVLLGGDLVDQDAELSNLRDLITSLGSVAPVFAIGGNHDIRIGIDRVRDAVIQGGGRWIHESTAHLAHAGRTIVVSGPARMHRDHRDDEKNGHVRILCAHNPRIWKTFRNAGYDLILAGHLHGCQVVAWWHRDRVYPGALFYPYCFLSHHPGSTRLVVSRGVSDLVPIRWRCPREVVLCHV
jgi:uncharacterized protein